MMKEETKESVLELRWFVLFLMGLTVFGCFYAYDSPVPIANFIIRDLGITKAQYGLLFSAYSLPNLIVVFLGGILVDKIGIRKAGILFASICFAGILITAASPTFLLMVCGRIIYGIGTDSFLVTNLKILSKWFKGKELSFALGLYITIVRLGNVASLNLGAPLEAWSGSWRLALWVSVAVMLFALISFLIYSRVDKRKEKYFQAEKETEKFVFRDIFQFKPPFWYLTLLCMTVYSAVYPFIAFSNIFLQKKFGLTAIQGGFYVSIIFISTMIFTPLFGLLVDKIGKRATILSIGSLLLIPVYLALGLTSLRPALPMVVIGISFSLVPAALWASVPILIEEKRLGTAFGLISSIQNMGLALFPWLAGKLTDLSGGEYRNTMILFAFLGFLGFLFSLWLRLSARKGKEAAIELPTGIAQA